MDIARLGVMAAFGVGLAAVSAWMYIKGLDGSRWGLVAFITWLLFLFSA